MKRQSTKRTSKKAPGARIRSGEAASKELGRLGVERGGAVRQGLRELMLAAGMATLQCLMHEEIEELCGPRYARKVGEGCASRWGSQETAVVLGGQKVEVQRPRARNAGREVPLATLEALQDEDPLNERALEQMAIGVSTRKYARSVEFSDVGTATSKSEVSRRFVLMTRDRMKKLLSVPLGATKWAALMVDGIEFADHVVLIALGIDCAGAKHVLGVREGSTENASVCHSLLSDIVGRGFPADRNLLVVVDGGKGLRKAVRKVFGAYAHVQRCTVHYVGSPIMCGECRSNLDRRPSTPADGVAFST